MREAARGTPSGGSVGAAMLSGGGSGTLGAPPTPNWPEAISAAVSGRPSGATRMRCHWMADSSSRATASSAAGFRHTFTRSRQPCFCTVHAVVRASVFSMDSRTISCRARSPASRVPPTAATHSLRRVAHSFFTAVQGTRSSSAEGACERACAREAEAPRRERCDGSGMGIHDMIGSAAR